VRASDVFGVFGRAQLDKLSLGAPYRAQVDSLLWLNDAHTFEIDSVTDLLQAQLAVKPGYQALLGIPGVGRELAGSSTPRSARCAGNVHALVHVHTTEARLGRPTAHGWDR
jgi:hypothetical protein